MEYKTLLYLDSVEMECSECRALFNRRPTFLEDSHYFTVSFLDRLMIMSRNTAPKNVAEWHDESCRTFQDIYYRELEKADHRRQVAPVRHLGIDEISKEKGHRRYLLLLYDLDTHEVIDVLQDRLKETLVTYLKEHKEDLFHELQGVCTDMWPKYKDAVHTVFPSMPVVVDRFHVIQQMNDAVEDRRREVQRTISDEEEKHRCKKVLRHVLLRARENQLRRDGGDKELQEVLSMDSELRRIYELKEDMRRIYTLEDLDEAKDELNKWIRRATYLNSKHLSSFIKTVKKWKKEILAFFKLRITNGVAEGLNYKTKLIKRLSYGLTNFGHFRLRILHTCGNTLL
jgi:transposase